MVLFSHYHKQTNHRPGSSEASRLPFQLAEDYSFETKMQADLDGHSDPAQTRWLRRPELLRDFVRVIDAHCTSQNLVDNFRNCLFFRECLVFFESKTYWIFWHRLSDSMVYPIMEAIVIANT